MRVVSLLPSATEIVCALGAEAELVGISHECDFPESIRDRPVLTRSRIDPSGTSRDIDRAVREVLQHALSVYDVDEPLLGSLSPDVIVTQALCEVCAVSLEDVENAVARLARRDALRVVSLSPTRLGDVFEDVLRVADALCRVEQGHALKSALEQRVLAIQARAAGLRRPRVASIEWIDPIMLGGTWMPELIELAGGEPVGAQRGGPAPTISGDALRALDPEIVLVKPCGFDLARSLRELDLVKSAISACVRPTSRVYVTDGNAFFNRPGPRLVESLEILAACVHPNEFAEFGSKHAPVLYRLR